MAPAQENEGETSNIHLESPSFYTPHPPRGITQTGTGITKNYHAFYSFMENQLIESVKASLNHELFANASFLCERLMAQVQNEDVKHLMA